MTKNIKDISKELLGKGLNSFHRKTGLPQVEKNDLMQDGILDGILSQTDDGYLEKTEQSSVIHLENSGDGIVVLGDIEGQTLVNYCENGNLEVTTNNEIDTEGYGHITLNDTTEGGVLDLSLEGDTLVNVCDQKDPIAITKSYTVENTNHIPLQGEYDGKARPVVHGNTMVNYCTDGSKELTLNNEINVEGTSVTLAEGVDNGLVDVLLEGNTLVNITSNGKDKTVSVGVNGQVMIPLDMIKINQLYTVVVNCKSNTLDGALRFSGWTVYSGENLSDGSIVYHHSPMTSVNKSDRDCYNIGQVGIYKTLIGFNSISQERNSSVILFTNSSTQGSATFDVVLLEGDWTNKEIPAEYFEGMKSVGECEDNKIEIKATGKNKIKLEDTTISTTNGLTISIKDNVFTINGTSKSDTRIKITNSYDVCYGEDYVTTFPIWGREIVDFVKIGKSYGTSWIYLDGQDLGVLFALKDKDGVTLERTEPNSNTRIYNNVNRNVAFIQIYIPAKTYVNHKVSLQIEEGKTTTEYEPYKENSIQLSLSEPLRALPNGVKDKIVKKEGKWYVERNCKQLKLTTDLQFTLRTDIYSNVDSEYKWYQTVNITDYKKQSNVSIICNQLATVTQYESSSELDSYNYPCMSLSKNKSYQILSIKIKKADINAFLNWIKDNDIQIVYELETPVYEEVTDPTLLTYLDTTHISNNSTIPCNMKVENTKYNCILKPSTKYTVALDCDKGQAIEVGLGGTKTTTTNNVTTITTPSTLTNNNLELYGKGVTVSNAMVFEGDVTSNLPSGYVEGLKSSFEDNRVPENLLIYGKRVFQSTGRWNCVDRTDIIKPNTVYTLIYNCDYRFDLKTHPEDKIIIQNLTGKGVRKFSITSEEQQIRLIQLDYDVLCNSECVIIEGDWTANPPTYEEVTNYGGKYKVEYKISGKNKFDYNNIHFNMINNIIVKENGTYKIPQGTKTCWIKSNDATRENP